MDIRTLYLAQTTLLTVTAAMLWASRGPTDRRTGMRTWTRAITAQAAAYLLLASPATLPAGLAATAGNFAGALSVALIFVAIRQFTGRPYGTGRLAVMVLVVTAMGAVTGPRVAAAAAFNGLVYALLEWLNGWALWRATPRHAPDDLTRAQRRIQRAMALAYAAMGLVLPLRSVAILAVGTRLDWQDLSVRWQQPLYLFGFVYLIITTYGFMLLCKMRAEADVRHQAATDDLTGLPNRRALQRELAHALAGSLRHGRPFALVLADIDRFKAINDSLGHQAGDAVLRGFAQRLQAALRAGDRAFRYGGEEFCVLLHDTGAEAAAQTAERLRQAVAAPAADGAPALSASLGVTSWRPGDDVDAIFGRVDRALYRAKDRGRDRVELD